MTHHFDRVALCSVSGRDVLIRRSLHMNVMRKKAMSRKLVDADEDNIFDCNVLNVRKKDTDQAGNDKNIKGKAKLDLDLKKNENRNEQTKGQRKYPITRSDNIFWN